MPRQSRSAATKDESPAAPDKLAALVAGRIQRDVIAAGWPIGRVFGVETELLERYNVSRAVFREAVRLLEHLGVVTTRRGPAGGLVVTAPSAEAVVEAVIVYLTFTGVSLGEVMEARIAIERTVAGFAAERADDDQIEQLRQRAAHDHSRLRLKADDHHQLHVLISSASKNPAGELFVEVLGRLTARWSYPNTNPTEKRQALEGSARAHTALVSAIASGDAALAERRMDRHLTMLADWLGRNRQAPRSLSTVLHEPEGEKLGRGVARSIMIDIIERGWTVGELIGVESELIEHYGVSRAAFREAVRLLEYFRMATMRRGPSGGLFVSTPTLGPIVRSAAVYLEFRRIKAADLVELERGLFHDAIALAVKRASDEDLIALRQTVKENAADQFEGPIERQFRAAVAGLTNNRAMLLTTLVLQRLQRQHTSVPPRSSAKRMAVNADSEHAQASIVEAMIARDTELAQRRWGKHLDAVARHLR